MMIYQDTFNSIFIYNEYGKITTSYGTSKHSIPVCLYVAKKMKLGYFDIIKFL